MGLEAECPVCHAYVPIDPEDAIPGSQIYCSYCSTQLMVTREMLEDEEHEGVRRVKVEEDWD